MTWLCKEEEGMGSRRERKGRLANVFLGRSLFKKETWEGSRSRVWFPWKYPSIYAPCGILSCNFRGTKFKKYTGPIRGWIPPLSKVSDPCSIAKWIGWLGKVFTLRGLSFCFPGEVILLNYLMEFLSISKSSVYTQKNHKNLHIFTQCEDIHVLFSSCT